MKLSSSHLSRQLPGALGLLLLASCARVPREVPTEKQPCTFSEQPKSRLSWQSGPGDFTMRGRVISVRDGRPWTHAVVRLSPGGRFASVDSSGEFELRRLRGGRYLVEVLTIGRVKAADSITIGDDGLLVLAAIAEYTPDIGCSRIAPPSTR